MKTNVFKTVEELVEFIREFEEQLDKTLDIDYFKLTTVLRPRQKNRSLENESDTYLYREIGASDSLSLMKRAERAQRPNDTVWMLIKPITGTMKKGK